ncbi:TonB-dependent receptor [Colwellia sp. MB02u-6]|uniref:TonB-dependent receptor n=1 Tax=Colwellia sp. MB02u-6 TaxID=2759824 RepID=UPI0015F49F32|nr:TonB-dependent receptor [Colwellia sp. MB02u-6]MBA6327850.1 TonB-dependent receptor [Colwellia sp. MB02u-6]
MYTSNISKFNKRTAIAIAVAGALTNASAYAAENDSSVKKKEKEAEIIVVTGFRSSLKASMLNKREAINVSDGITAEDLGKFPDQNVAESLQRITGVSIDRSGGEGQYVSVRGFGPQFNMVTVNGRQMATENSGREFSFDTLAAELITGADVYKSPTAEMQEGGIGATVNIKTARPFNFEGFKAAGSVKGVYDDLSGETSPQVSGLITNTFMDNRLGVLVSASHQQRDSQTNMMETRYYRPGVNFTAQNGKEFNNVNVPQNFDIGVDEQERTRTSGTAVIQYAPNDELTLTFDGLISKFEVDSQATNAGHWFSEGNFIDAEVDENNTVVYIENSNAGATDFIRRSFGREVDMNAFGLNIEYMVNDALTMTVDLSRSNAQENSGGKEFFNVIGYNNAYTWDNRAGGDAPTLSVAGGDAALLNAEAGKAHYNERNGWDRDDQLNEYRVDFEWETGQDTFTQMRWGVYSQNRTKEASRLFASDCGVYCGYGTDVSSALLTPYVANDFFAGVPNTWLTYDPAEYGAYRASLDPITGEAYNNPTSQSDAYTVEEDVVSAYVDFIFEGELGDMPWTVNAGVRYSKTDANLSGITRELVDLEPIPNDPSDLNEIYAAGDNGTPVTSSNKYTNILPSMNLKLELTDEMLVRLAYSETLTRPTMSALNPAVTITNSRPNNNQASGGNADLKPYLSTNWDFSYEYYYADTSNFVLAVFSKEVDSFITSTVAKEVFNLESGSYDFDVRRPRNGDVVEVNGLEIAWTHTWESGFGIQANATFVDSDATIDDSASESFALEGLGDSQNIIAFYEKGPFQTRIAYNKRDEFLQNLVSPFGGSEPLYTESYAQWDISASYDINETITLFGEGINITNEETRRHGRHQNQFVRLESTGARWAVGVRASF